MMKRLTLTGLAGAVSLMSVLAMPVHAADAVTCTFIVAQDPALNVKAGFFRTRQIVNAADLGQLVPSDQDAAVIAQLKEDVCRIRHNLDSRIDVFIEARDLQIDPEGALPACEDLKVSVMCRAG